MSPMIIFILWHMHGHVSEIHLPHYKTKQTLDLGKEKACRLVY